MQERGARRLRGVIFKKAATLRLRRFGPNKQLHSLPLPQFRKVELDVAVRPDGRVRRDLVAHGSYSTSVSIGTINIRRTVDFPPFCATHR